MAPSSAWFCLQDRLRRKQKSMSKAWESGLLARQLLTDVALFFYRPWPAAKRLQFGRPFVFALTILLVLDLAFAALSEALLSGAEAIGYKPLEFIDDDDWNLHEEWIIAVLAGPIVEEALFRGWLSGRLRR